MQPSASLQSQQRNRRKRQLPHTFQSGPTPEGVSDGGNPTGQNDGAPRKLTGDECDEIRQLMQQQLKGKVPRDFQVDMVIAQEERRDALCHAATGLGKTLIAAAPFTLSKNGMRVTIMVSPLVALQNEMVRYKLSGTL